MLSRETSILHSLQSYIFFLTAKDEGTLNHNSKPRYPTSATTQAKRSSRTTSFPEGMEAPVPGLGRLSRRDRALPALHAKMELHLRNHAAFTRFCSRTGTDSAFAFARLRRKWAVSSDHRPPVSAAKTTRRARPPSPTNSGNVVSFLRRASSRATPARLAAPLLGLPSRRRGDTNVVSIANWAPCHKVNPSAITSILRPSRALKAPTSRSRTKALGGHPSPSLAAHLGCSTLKRKPPLSQNPCLGARCSMMAKLVELAATSACARGQRQRQTEASAQQDAEKLGLNSGHPVGGHRREDC